MRNPPAGSPADYQQSGAEADNLDDGIEVPDYLSEIRPLTQKEYCRWDAHIAARTVWRESELVSLYTLIQLETRIFNAMPEILTEDLTIINNAGNVVGNPAHTVFAKMQNDALAIRRSLGLDADKAAVQRQFTRAKGKSTGKSTKKKPSKAAAKKAEVSNLIKLPKY